MRSVRGVLNATCLVSISVSVAACGIQDEPQDLAETTHALLTTGPDLTESDVSASATTVKVGTSFSVTDTVTNQGALGAGASQTVYYLSTTASAPFNNVLRFGTQRPVVALASGAAVTGTTSLVVSSAASQVAYTNATLYLVACSDYGNAVVETDERNNCSAGPALTVQSPDLVVTAATEPPGDVLLGQQFPITTTTSNTGMVAAGAFTNVFYLSTTGVAPYSNVLRFPTQQPISGIDIGQTHVAAATIFAPAGYNPGLDAFFGTFYLVTCADYGNAVIEGNEGNNCHASSGTVYVHGPDLAISNVTMSANTIDTVAGAVTFGDTITNLNTTTAPPSAVGYILSTDTVRDPSDGVLTACSSPLGAYWTRNIPALGFGASDTGTDLVGPPCVDDGSSVHVPPVGTYYVFVCADIYRSVFETNERNNCVRLDTQLNLSLCGNNVVEGNEQCDDGGRLPGDGCSATCTIETNAAPAITSTPPSTAFVNNVYTYNATAVDADGPTRIWSLLDDTCGGTINAATGVYTFTPAATGTCVLGVHICDGGLPNQCASQATTITKAVAICGNGVVEPGEQCDDSNTRNGDGCGATCQTQTLTSVSVTPSNGSVAKGTTEQCTATARYSDGWTNDVTATASWATGNTAIATVSTAGVVTGVDNTATGGSSATTTIAASFGGTAGSTNVTVIAPVVVDLVVSPPDSSIAKFTKQQFQAEAVYSDATVVDVTSATTWSSGTTAIATITSTGLATGVAAGDATISGTFSGLTDSTTLTITNATLSSIAVTPANATMSIGTSQQYTATGTFSDATTQDLSSYATWLSTQTAYATVSSTGVVTTASSLTGSSATTNIRATFQSVTGSTGLTVVRATLQSIAVTPASATVPNGFSTQLTATATYKTASTTFTLDVSSSAAWTSSSTTIATVSGSGLATGKGVGSATITATYGGKSGSASVAVTNATLVSIAITPNPVSVAKRTSTQLTATGTFSNATTLNITTQVSWASSSKSIASVNGRGKLRGKKAGAATITATKNGISGTDGVTVH